mgnify:CR=1 FL=1
MKFLKKVLAAVACVCVLATSVTLTSHAAGGRISFADPSTAVGDMVDVKCVLKSSSGSLGSSSVTLSYDASALKFNSGDGVTPDILRKWRLFRSVIYHDIPSTARRFHRDYGSISGCEIQFWFRG